MQVLWAAGRGCGRSRDGQFERPLRTTIRDVAVAHREVAGQKTIRRDGGPPTC